ncbi:metal-dependent hydrolase [Virgibacillus halodenitrificans]|uniref:Metal-dependent hydrolase n=1 Tax=Virgibacillus halodenitrificans TaxID=1482 RepID=A0ABR7VTL6_VIRHA|nr:metal-dependent hydrolase [Virgibacillus halodenitrificans]MBD1224087.1 metal-dependent hydrolase [Virgibacillus halodenitrificans]MCJ0932457.1 metal-dependent hydrolase [Virgibacillus halodenitrificans]MEC2160113.1 metal-dependent hydrolase [Virgibacillus halodenitrificans]MYL44959.1 metal-dependent hydrolase [Virgibacillus halodenitrificans]
MNGTAHAAIGAAAGFIIANKYQTDPTTTIWLVGIGGVSGLIPDLDIDGKLRGKITLSHHVFRTIAQLIAILIMGYSFYEGTDTEKYVGIGIGLVLLGIASSIKQKHMLLLTGIGVLGAGATLQETWLMLLGIYILIASLVAHRSYTHSLLGLIFFGIIASKLEVSLGKEGIFLTCMAGYISHLLADSKLLPINKRGVKLFLPLSSKEF